jgi:hypothetical protein
MKKKRSIEKTRQINRSNGLEKLEGGEIADAHTLTRNPLDSIVRLSVLREEENLIKEKLSARE